MEKTIAATVLRPSTFNYLSMSSRIGAVTIQQCLFLIDYFITNYLSMSSRIGAVSIQQCLFLIDYFITNVKDL